jgi:DNA-binding XRE family transcriptional regulator
MSRYSDPLQRELAALANGRAKFRSRSLARNRVLRQLIADLVNARAAAGMTQENVAHRMLTTKSAISRLESGVRTRPTLRTIQRYAFAVQADVHIRVIPWRR